MPCFVSRGCLQEVELAGLRQAGKSQAQHAIETETRKPRGFFGPRESAAAGFHETNKWPSFRGNIQGVDSIRRLYFFGANISICIYIYASIFVYLYVHICAYVLFCVYIIKMVPLPKRKVEQPMMYKVCLCIHIYICKSMYTPQIQSKHVIL